MASVFVSEEIPSTTSKMDISLSTHDGPILSPVRTHGQQVTPPPVGSSVFRPYVTGFMMPLNCRRQPYGIPTSMMANFHNTMLILDDLLANMLSPLQGYGSVVNNTGRINQPSWVGFSTQQMLNFTTNSAAVLRQ